MKLQNENGFLAWHIVVPSRANVARELFFDRINTLFYEKNITACFNMFFACTKLVRCVWY